MPEGFRPLPPVSPRFGGQRRISRPPVNEVSRMKVQVVTEKTTCRRFNTSFVATLASSGQQIAGKRRRRSIFVHRARRAPACTIPIWQAVHHRAAGDVGDHMSVAHLGIFGAPVGPPPAARRPIAGRPVRSPSAPRPYLADGHARTEDSYSFSARVLGGGMRHRQAMANDRQRSSSTITHRWRRSAPMMMHVLPGSMPAHHRAQTSKSCRKPAARCQFTASMAMKTRRLLVNSSKQFI